MKALKTPPKTMII